LRATIKTGAGDIRLILLPEKAPVTCASFAMLCEEGFYDGLTFHRVEKGFVAQFGCPLHDGRGGPGYAFQDEITDLKFDLEGVLAMANAGRFKAPDGQEMGTNGSQVFITLGPAQWLNGKHTIFGTVDGADSMRVTEETERGTVIESLRCEMSDEERERLSPIMSQFKAALADRFKESDQRS